MKIEICMGSSCFARGNFKNLQIIEAFKQEHDEEISIYVKGSFCENFCTKGPNIAIDGKKYNGVEPNALIDILNKKLRNIN